MNEMCHLITNQCADSEIEIDKCALFDAYSSLCYEVIHVRVEWRIGGICRKYTDLILVFLVIFSINRK